MIATKKKEVIKVGDLVKIVNSEFFIRAGYLLSPRIIMEEINNNPKQKEKIFELLEFFGIRRYSHNVLVSDENPKTIKCFNKITNILAYQICRSRCFGGETRQIFTEEKPEYKDKIFRVVGKFTKKTGEYYPPSSYQGYFDPYPEHEPGGLKNEKTHVILEIAPVDEIYLDGLKIEAKNVEIVPKERHEDL